jgi:hypothetical protein
MIEELNLSLCLGLVFHCSTNLQRHQWIYVAGLAIKVSMKTEIAGNVITGSNPIPNTEYYIWLHYVQTHNETLQVVLQR